MLNMEKIYASCRKFIDMIDVPSLAALSGYLLALRELLGILLGAITIGYTLWKWRREYLENKRKKYGANTKKSS